MPGVPKADHRQSFLRIAGVPGLLGYSFVLTLARATTLPFIAVYLTRVLKMELTQVGVTLSIVLALGTVTSLCGGYLVDRVRSVVMLAGTAFAAGGIFFLLPSISGTFALIAWLSGLYAILAVSSIAVKATISQTVLAAFRVPIYSLNYTLVNVGFAVGPLISVYLIASEMTLAFRVAAGFACLAAIIAVMFSPQSNKADDHAQQLPSLRDTLRALRGDAALALFTLGGLLSAVVYDQFSAYLSQYLLTQLSSEAAYRLIGQIVTANAVVVIATQFLLGRYIKRRTLFMFVCIGTGCLVLGLIGFSASNLTWIWIASMAIFTIGEVVLVPSEYLYVDLIAPDNMRGAYFALHNLGALGGAASPVLCAVLLAQAGPPVMFAALIACALGGAVFYAIGHRLADGNGVLPKSEELVNDVP